MTEENKPFLEHKSINDSGMLDVGDGHSIYWIDWGNKKAENVIFYLHGGPGGGVSERDFDKFDEKKHRVIFHDQRGSSRSTPFASIKSNTTDDLVGDINKLRKHLGLEQVSLYGHSWGSTLALVYTIRNPKVVKTMLIGGIFLGRKQDENFYLNGAIKTHFPEAWQEFYSMVPRDSNNSVGQYFKQMMFGDDEAKRKQYARAWMLFEASVVSLDYQPKKIARELDNWASESLAYLEAHYILNNCFIPENYILDNAHVLKNTKTVIIHGRYDFVCMPSGAVELKHAIGDNAVLHMVAGGHSSGETVVREVYKAYSNILW